MKIEYGRRRVVDSMQEEVSCTLLTSNSVSS